MRAHPYQQRFDRAFDPTQPREFVPNLFGPDESPLIRPFLSILIAYTALMLTAGVYACVQWLVGREWASNSWLGIGLLYWMRELAMHRTSSLWDIPSFVFFWPTFAISRLPSVVRHGRRLFAYAIATSPWSDWIIIVTLLVVLGGPPLIMLYYAQ